MNRAFEVLQVPTLGLWSGRAFEKQGKLVEAFERFMETARLSPDAAGDPKVQAKAIASAQKEAEELQERIPVVVVSVEGADPDQVDVTIDGVDVSCALYDAGRPTNPGQVSALGTLGEQRVEEEVELAEGEEKRVTLTFAPTAASEAGAKGGAAIAPGATPPPEADRGSGGSWQPPSHPPKTTADGPCWPGTSIKTETEMETD